MTGFQSVERKCIPFLINFTVTFTRKEKKKKEAGGQGFTPVILVIQEAEIRRIIVRNQPQANSS
jgi:hypothetical protein